ncbi:hypothetical protein [Roseinatronobacter sp. NSM]|uniref:hypothetical protein n=1 Tax=Roseinatronobacter sp. NSM TaxID=3457785 RepID=UPI004035BBD9
MSSKLSIIRVVLPWPAKEVWPNFIRSNHWSKWQDKAKVQKEYAHYAAKEVIGRQEVPRDREGKWKVHLHIFPPNLRRFDEDGVVGAQKSALDGIALALGVDDSLFAISHTIHAPHRPMGGVIVSVTAPNASYDEIQEDLARMMAQEARAPRKPNAPPLPRDLVYKRKRAL